MTDQAAVILRADGGPAIGGGHMRRARVLIEALLRLGYRVIFLTKDTDWVRGLREEFPCDLHYLRPDDNESLIVSRTAARVGAQLIILDVLDTSEEYVRYLKETGAKVLTIDDLGRGAGAADATFKGGAKPRREGPYHHGPEYAILSPEVLALREGSLPPAAGPKRAVVFLGTFDQRRHGRVVLEVVDRFPAISFDWFTSDAHPTRSNLRIFRADQKPFLAALAAADLAILSGGVTLFEAAALGRPAIVLPQGSHEPAQAQLFVDAGAALLAPAPKVDDVTGLLSRLSTESGTLAKMHHCGKRFIDGRGLERFLECVRTLAGS